MRGPNDDSQSKIVSLVESFRGSWFKLPIDVMRDVGPAVQTLGAILKITKRETFVEVEKIADTAMLTIPIVRKHLNILEDGVSPKRLASRNNRAKRENRPVLATGGWITNIGRQLDSRSGFARRSCTIRVEEKTRKAAKRYAVLPAWACRRLDCRVTDDAGYGSRKSMAEMPWSSRAVLAVVLAKLLKLTAAAEKQFDAYEDEEVWTAIEEMGGDIRFQFSLSELHDETGLDHKSITAAKIDLSNRGLLDWTCGDGKEPDILRPLEGLKVMV